MSVSVTWRPRPADAPAGVRTEAPEDGPTHTRRATDAAALVAADERPALHAEQVSAEGGLRGCLACGHPELFTQRDFPRALGLAIVVLAAVLAPFTLYLSLVAAAVLDWVLYRTSPKLVVCYVCRAEHRGFAETPRHPAFDREIDERLRYGEKAVMGKPMRPGGTADAPEPEH